jgi:hypothetical protein
MDRIARGKLKKLFWAGGALWILLLVLPVRSHAERPLVTEYAGTVEKGYLEVEMGFDHFREAEGDRSFVPSIQIAFGVTERLQISAGLPYIFLDPAGKKSRHGPGDLLAYLKYRVWGESGYFPAASLKPFLIVPTGDAGRDLGSGSPEIGLTSVLSESFAGFNLHLDGTYILSGKKQETGQASFGLAGEFEVVKGFNLVGEVRCGNNFNSSRKDDPATLMAGFQAEIAGAVFDAGLTLGLNSAAPDYLTTVGVTLTFK